jgi:hypothetical protein
MTKALSRRICRRALLVELPSKKPPDDAGGRRSLPHARRSEALSSIAGQAAGVRELGGGRLRARSGIATARRGFPAVLLRGSAGIKGPPTVLRNREG